MNSIESRNHVQRSRNSRFLQSAIRLCCGGAVLSGHVAWVQAAPAALNDAPLQQIAMAPSVQSLDELSKAIAQRGNDSLQKQLFGETVALWRGDSRPLLRSEPLLSRVVPTPQGSPSTLFRVDKTDKKSTAPLRLRAVSHSAVVARPQPVTPKTERIVPVASTLLAQAATNITPVTPPVATTPAATIVAPTVVAGVEIRRNAAGEPLVTNSFADTDLKQALADITAQTGVPIIADNTVQGTVSLELRDVPLERALTMLLRAGGFSSAKIDDYYLVGNAEPANPNFYLFSRTEIVQLKNVRPEVVLDLLSVPYGRYLSSEGSTRVTTARGGGDTGDFRRSVSGGFGSSSSSSSSRTNTGSSDVGLPAPTYKIAITAPPALIERIKADVLNLDQQREQVMLEALVLEISEDDLKDIGFNFASRFLQFSTTGSGSNFAYSSIAGDQLVQISALVQKGAARLRANPRIATGDGQTAEMEVGRENYFTIVTGSTNFAYNTLEVIRSGISLRITPRILQDGNEVVALVEPEVRDVTGRGPNGLPEITFRRAATNVRVKNGESIVIGGLINDFDITSENKIPVLGDLPLVGKLFRGTNARKVRTETVIIITPRVLRDDLVRDGVQAPGLQQELQKFRNDNRRDPEVAPTP